MMHCFYIRVYLVNGEMFAQYIFSRILHRVLDARKYYVSGKRNHYRAHRAKVSSRARCAKISLCENITFTVGKHDFKG